MIGAITGSGFYKFDRILETKTVATYFGEVILDIIELKGKEIAHISRHGKNHEILSSQINHRANIAALSSLGVKLIIGTTVCGITNVKLELAKILLFNDLFYPDNRLPNGELCTFFTKIGDPKRGHFMFANPFSILNNLGNAYENVVYGHANGPRFNSKSEINFIKNHADAISQTCGPETVLSGELEIPYVLMGYGVDYANGIKDQPTPIDELKKNLKNSRSEFQKAIEQILLLQIPKFEGFVYRFE